MNDLFKYLIFQWQAKNLHAIHSPFLFEFIKKAVYRNSLPAPFNHSFRGQERLLLSILYYFHFKNIYINSPSKDYKKMIKSYQNLEPETKCFSGKDLENRAHHFDLYILNDLKSKSEGLRILKKMNTQKQNFVIIPQLRASKVQLDFFKSLPKERNGFVMLEFYRFALLIDRKESSGEYFKIRKWGAF